VSGHCGWLRGGRESNCTAVRLTGGHGGAGLAGCDPVAGPGLSAVDGGSGVPGTLVGKTGGGGRCRPIGGKGMTWRQKASWRSAHWVAGFNLIRLRLTLGACRVRSCPWPLRYHSPRKVTSPPQPRTGARHSSTHRTPPARGASGHSRTIPPPTKSPSGDPRRNPTLLAPRQPSNTVADPISHDFEKFSLETQETHAFLTGDEHPDVPSETLRINTDRH
jgi:hypothetical protein